MAAKKGVEEALALLERAVEEKGADYRYPDSEKQPGINIYSPMCVYRREDGGPSCIIGHVAHYEGFLDMMREGKAARSSSALEARFTSAAVSVFDAAQREQDNGKPWGRALKAAKARAVKR